MVFQYFDYEHIIDEGYSRNAHVCITLDIYVFTTKKKENLTFQALQIINIYDRK